MTEQEIKAQVWHEEQVELDPEHEKYASCWCCCKSCDPDWVQGAGNPYFTSAEAAMRAEVDRNG